jgi:hypothetical protein
MPLTASAVDVLGIATLVLVVLLACLGLGCVLYVLRFRARVNKERLPVALKDFNALWIVRITLILLAMLWCLVELLRLPLLRRQNWLLHSISFRWQANMCRIYILSSIGFLEPCFFLTALFLVHGSLSNAPFTPRKAWNGKMVALILICCLPVFLLQLFFVVISPSFEFKGGYSAQKEGYNLRLPSYFTEAFEGVQLDSQRQVAVCRFPLLSTLVLATFGVIYSAYFLLLGWRMLGVVINRCLQRRVYGLLASLLFLLPLHVLFLGMSVLSSPTHWVFELLAFLAFLTVLLCTSVGEGILVIRPIMDALAVHWVLTSPEHLGWQIEAAAALSGSERPLSISLSMFGSDDDEAALVHHPRHNRIRRTSLDTDVEFVAATAGRKTFIPVDRAGSFSDHQSGGIAFGSPDSPALPGKPLLSRSSHSNSHFL